MQRIRDELRRASVPALAVFTAFLLGAIVIVLTDFEHLRQIGTDPLAAIGGALAGVVDGYRAMFSGAIGDPGRIVAAIQSGNADDIAAAIRPISETLVSATPFIFAGLGLAVSFRAGLFNLGVDGQFLIGRPGRRRSRRRSWRGTCRRSSPWWLRCSAGPSPAARTGSFPASSRRGRGRTR